MMLLPQHTRLGHHCETWAEGCKAPFCCRQLEQVGKELTEEGVTHLANEVIPLFRSEQLPIAFAHLDSLLHQTKFE